MTYFFKRIKRLFKASPDLYVKVYSHPRSGTHFLEGFIAKNFYGNSKLSIDKVTWGHWSNRKINTDGNPYGKLFGNHYFADRNTNTLPKIYIYRDGRAVAYSIWKTQNFVHKDIKNLSFKTFLRTKIDWYGSPSIQAEPTLTILEHWLAHVKSWIEASKLDSNILLIKYEDLVNEPYIQYEKIHRFFFNKTVSLQKNEIDCIAKPIGLLPNKAKPDAWKEVFDEEDLKYYIETVGNHF